MAIYLLVYLRQLVTAFYDEKREAGGQGELVADSNIFFSDFYSLMC